jgi:hypothetical protein
MASSRALASAGDGGDGENPGERERANPSAIAEDMLWCCVPFGWVIVGERGGASSSTSSASRSGCCAVGCCAGCCAGC